MEENSLEKSDENEPCEKPASISESDHSSRSDPIPITSKECSTAGSLLLLLTSPEVSPTCIYLNCVAEDQLAVVPLSDSRVESLVPVLPVQEESRGALSNAILSMSAPSASVEFVQILRKEYEQLSSQLSETLIACVNRMNLINERLAIPSTTDSDGIGAGAIATKRKADSEQMLHAVIREAVQGFQNFSSHFNKMGDKIVQQWVPAIDTAKVYMYVSVNYSAPYVQFIEKVINRQTDLSLDMIYS